MWRPQKSALGAKVRAKQSSAIKRLLQDLKDITDNTVPTVGVVALPLEKDLLTWHCNIRGPKGTHYEGGVFHLILEFPKTYPVDPPTVTVCTTLHHPNVFGGKICLDMLQPEEEQERYIGWSSAYSAQAVLIQLQSFLFEESSSIRAEDYRAAIESANNFSCKSCKHKPLRVWPPFPVLEKEAFIFTKTELDIIQEELVCFHSKRTFRDGVLGFGISFTKNIRTGDIQDISSPLDLIGIKAFMREDIRKSSINEPFTHWIPVYINDEHGDRAFHLAKRALSMICAGNTKEFKPEMALKVFPKLMNTVIVQMMKGQIYTSIKALEGYCAFHQMFIKFLLEFPELQKACEETVLGFLKDSEKRHKNVTPNLGEFLPLVTVVPQISWKDIAPVIIEESFDRQVAPLIRDYPELAKEEEDAQIDKERVNVTLGSSIVSLRLFMFHMYFLEFMAKPLGRSIEETFKNYGAQFGRPTVRMIEDMQQAFRDIKKVKTHTDFFGRIGMPILSDEEMRVSLRKHVINSRMRGYHGVEGLKAPSPEELLEESLKLVVPLSKLCLPTEEGKETVLHSNEDEWRELCKSRWGFSSIPKEYTDSGIDYPWKHLYLQNNLQDLIRNLNDRPDFPTFYEALRLSASTLRQLEVTLVNPRKIKSGFHFITAFTSKLTNLEHLTLIHGPEGAVIGIKGARALMKGLKSSSGSLLSLDITGAGIDSSVTNLLSEGILATSKLTSLKLTNNALGVRGVTGLTSLLWGHKNITELNLSRCGIDANAAKELADGLLANKKLRTVCLSRNPLGDAGLRAIIYNLAFSPSVEHLDLSSVTSSSGDASVAEALTKLFKITVTLSHLNFWKTQIATSFNRETIAALGKNRSLTHLDLSSIGSLSATQLGYFGNALAVNETLKVLFMDNDSIAGSGVESLYRSLFILKESEEEKGKEKVGRGEEREMRRLEMLDKQKEAEKEFHFALVEWNLSNNSLSDNGKILGKVVHISKSLEVLIVENCKLNFGVGETLGLALEENVSLRKLCLKQNNLGKEGAKSLAAGLERNPNLKLEHLDISGNGIGVSGARALAAVLAKNRSITSLNLFGNMIDVDGARSVARALKTNTTLTDLDLGLNRIRDKGALELASVVGDHPSLKILGLKLNFLKNQGALAISRAIAKSKVTKFSLAGNEFDDSNLVQIFEMFKDVDREIDFDLASRIAIIDPDRVARSVWVTPLSSNVKKESVRKYFYDNHCGIILHVSIHDHVTKAAQNKAKYAFVEFAHINSVNLALDLFSSGKKWIDRQVVRVYRVGSQTKKAENNNKGTERGREAARGRASNRGRGTGRGRDVRREAPRPRGAPKPRGWD